MDKTSSYYIKHSLLGIKDPHIKHSLLGIKDPHINSESSDQNNRFDPYIDNVIKLDNSFYIDGIKYTSNYYLGRIFYYKVLKNEYGKYMYLIGEEHSKTSIEPHKKIMAVREFLTALSDFYTKSPTPGQTNKRIVLLHESGSPFFNDVKSGGMSDTVAEIYNTISVDLRHEMIINFYAKYFRSNFDVNKAHPWTITYSHEDCLLFKEYYFQNCLSLIKEYFPYLKDEDIKSLMLDEKLLQNYKNHNYNPTATPIIEITAILVAKHFYKKDHLIYYAHYEHIKLIYENLRTLFPELIYENKIDLKDFWQNHCKSIENNTKRICDQKYLVNIIPKLITPHEDKYLELLEYYKKTVERKKLPIK